MANELVKMAGGPIAMLGDTVNVISKTILECKKEEAKTECLEIQAKVYIHNKNEETKQVLANLKLENDKDERKHYERIAEIEAQMLKNFYEYDTQLKKIKNREEEIKEKLKLINICIEESNKIEENILTLFKENPNDSLNFEYLKVIMNFKENVYKERINLLKEIIKI